MISEELAFRFVRKHTKRKPTLTGYVYEIVFQDRFDVMKSVFVVSPTEPATSFKDKFKTQVKRFMDYPRSMACMERMLQEGVVEGLVWIPAYPKPLRVTQKTKVIKWIYENMRISEPQNEKVVTLQIKTRDNNLVYFINKAVFHKDAHTIISRIFGNIYKNKPLYRDIKSESYGKCV
jgi:hypothetical protein